MTHQPDDIGEAYAELQQDDLTVVDDGALTANTDETNHRQDDESSGPLDGTDTDTDISTDRKPPAGA